MSHPNLPNGYNSHIAVLKGIAMLGIIWEHATLSFSIPVIDRIPTMLMLPLFVIASGYCFKDVYVTHRQEYVKKRIKSLYWPFVKWGAVFVLLHNVFCRIGFYPAGTPLYSWHDMAARVPHILVMHSPETLVGANWFITELFFGCMLFIAFVPLIRRWPLAWVAGFALVAAALNVTEFHIRLRDVSFMCASYYTLGYLMRRVNIAHGWPVIALMAALFALGSLTVPGNFSKMNAMWLIPNYATVIAGSWAVAGIAWHIAASGRWMARCLAYIGNRTLIILVLHFTAMHLVSWALVATMHLPHDYVAQHPVITSLVWSWPIYFAAGVAVPLAFDWMTAKVGEYLKAWWNKHRHKA